MLIPTRRRKNEDKGKEFESLSFPATELETNAFRSNRSGLSFTVGDSWRDQDVVASSRHKNPWKKLKGLVLLRLVGVKEDSPRRPQASNRN
jgi:hypothetical protein